jgi:ERCC4-related helicase
LPSYASFGTHPRRHSDFEQVVSLYKDLGPSVVGMYMKSVLPDLQVKEFESETQAEFQQAKAYLLGVYEHCQQQCAKPGAFAGGRTDKLLKLEELLDREIALRPDAAGIVFTSTRMTAMALNHYFQTRADSGSSHWLSSSDRLSNLDSAKMDASSQHMIVNDDDDDDDAFMDADSCDDPSMAILEGHCLQMSDAEPIMQAAPEHNMDAAPTRDRRIKTGCSVAKNGLCFNQSVENISDTLQKLGCGEINVLFATSVVEEGVDVPACSFVAAFDRMASVKRYEG